MMKIQSQRAPLWRRAAPRNPEDTPQASLVKRAIRLKAVTVVHVTSKASNAEPLQNLLTHAASVQPREGFGIATDTTETTRTTEVANLYEENHRVGKATVTP